MRQLGRSELLSLYDAAAEAIECAATLANAGKNPVTEVLGGGAVVEEWAHFPAGDVVDRATHSQFYYHAHTAAERIPGEHGHFHTFARVGPGDAVSHLVGISTDARGNLLRLFTTNRWVTGETWHDADAVIPMLERFDIGIAAPSRALNRWVSAIVRLFRPQIVELIGARDRTIAAWRAAHPQRDVFEDRELQVTSELPVDLLTQIRAVEAALAAG